MRFINPIKYIKKKISNALMERKIKKRHELLSILQGKQHSVNQKWWLLMKGKEYLHEAEYQKWNYFLTNYENIKNPK